MKELCVTNRGKIDITYISDLDDEIRWWHSFNMNIRGYPYTHIYIIKEGIRKRTTIFLHQLIAQRMELIIPEGYQIDHKDRNKLNNQRENLRIATGSQNTANIGKRSTNTTNYKNVIYQRESRRYRAKIVVNGEFLDQGTYSNPIDAARAADRAAIYYRKDFAELNFPKSDYL